MHQPSRLSLMVGALLVPACAAAGEDVPGSLRFAYVLAGAPRQPEAAQPEAAPAAPAGGSHAGGDAELAKKLANPVADLISIPFQSNWDFGFGPDDDGWRYTLNIEPVIPISITDDWNIITRTIVPVIYQEDVTGPGNSEGGLGDITASQFFSPKAPGPGGIIWGIGPAWLIPTATDDVLGHEKWGVGPTGVVLKQHGPWTYGALANHIWSFAGDGRSEVNATFLQPFVAHTFPDSTAITVNTETTYDWSESEWTIPVNVMVGRIFRLGKLPVNFQIGGRYYIESPDGGPEWGLRLNIVILLPK